MSAPLRLASLVVGLVSLVATACTGVQSSGSTPDAGGAAAADEVGASAPSAALLDQALSAYVACVRPQLDGYLRVDFERFMGVQGEVSLPDGRDDAARIDQVVTECEQSSGWAERLTALRSSFELSREQATQIGENVVECLRRAGLTAYADEYQQRDPQDAKALEQAQGEIPFPSEPTVGQELLDCVNGAMYGQRRDF